MGIDEKLKKMNFKCVLGMTEIGRRGTNLEIKKGLPLTWDKNNGVTVVYDEKGVPWVHRGIIEFPELKRGAHVPMSNDGGWGIMHLFPTLEEKRETCHGVGSFTAAQFLSLLDVGEFTTKPLKFTQPIDAVIIGTCSTGNGHGFFAHTVLNNRDINKEYFVQPLANLKERPKTVLLISECCMAYSEDQQAQIREAFPDINWIVPQVRDYGERPSIERLYEDLVRLQLIVESIA